MKELTLDMELLSFLIEFGYTELITTTHEAFEAGELIAVYERDKHVKMKAQVTSAFMLKKRASGLLCYHITISYVG